MLKLQRFYRTESATIGKLTYKGRQFYTLEDTEREIPGEPVSVWKIPAKTAIPRGTYNIVLDISQRFKRVLPRLLDVPGFTGVRIHPGNAPEDTEGCILVGVSWDGANRIGDSRQAFSDLMALLATADHELSIEIS